MKSMILTIVLGLNLIWLPQLHADPTNQVQLAKLDDAERTAIITTRIKHALENIHYRKMKIDDTVSKQAFKQFIERLDYGKQFFLQSDVKKLSKHENNINAELKTGKLYLLDDSVDLLKKRIAVVQKMQQEIFKSKFDFSQNEFIEGDPDKREFCKTDVELREIWRKTLKQATLSRYVGMLDDQKSEQKALEESKKKKVDPTKNGVKKTDSLIGLSETVLLDKAHEAIQKKYANLFDRMLKDEYEDYLEKYLNAVTTVFDPHTNYFPPSKKEDFDIEMSGSLEGIGAVLQEDPPYIKVVEIVPGGAAWRQKELEVDDIILAVAQGDGDAVDLVDMRVGNAVRYIRGKKGTEVRLTVKKTDGTRKVIRIIREVVETGASFAKSSILKSKKLGHRVGYIQLPKFYRDFDNANGRNCTDDVKKELISLKKKNVSAVILDLRNNGGGSLGDANNMSGLFIKSGPIVQVRDNFGKTEVLEDTDTEVVYDGPLVVMVNRLSASASEILAGAMQDYKRAVIVGSEFTHGKGTVQVIFELNRGTILNMMGPTLGALKITLQKFYRVTGASTQFKGVTPDLFLPDIYSFDKNREQDLDNALPWDEVKGLKYDKWNDFPYQISSLKSRSNERVQQNSKFKTILENIKTLKEKREDTRLTLNLQQYIKEQEENRLFVEKMKNAEKNLDIDVSDFETALKFDEANKKKTDSALWKKDFEKRKSEWIEGLQKDVDIEETLNIIDDMLRMKKGIALRA